jgi:GNAT superfamily N-acetyltransferase
MQLQIRRGQLEDKNSVFRLAQQFNTGREPITRDEFTVVFETLLQDRENETTVLFVAVDVDAQQDGEATPQRIVGYTLTSVSRLLHAAGLSAHLHEVVVDSEARGSGVGESLIRANEQYCARRGVRQISASTARFGTFFNHLGFEVVGEHFRKMINTW